MTDPARTAAIVLAAGSASRFGSPKLLARLGGRPVLQHVLDTLAGSGLGEVIVVLGDAAGAVEQGIAWHGERRVRNPRPGDGLASSLRLGLGAVSPAMQAALIVLGDQPLLRADVVNALLSAERSPTALAVVPAYADGGANPVLLLRSGFGLVDRLQGDQGLGAELARQGGAVLRLPVAGANPDVDTPGDLARLAEAAWAARVRANREQVDRLREVPDGRDFYGPVASIFRADPTRADDPVLDLLLGEARSGETWVDVGAGAGRYALPLARRVGRVIAVDPSEGMLSALREIAAEHGIANVRTLQERWPMSDPPRADVALIAHVGYDVEEIGTFVDALEAAARRLCVAVLMERQPASTIDPFWPPIHDEPRVSLPALPEFLELLEARGAHPDVTYTARPPSRFTDFDELVAFARRQTWVAEGGEKDGRLLALLRERALETRDGWTLPAPEMRLGVVRWAPAARQTAAKRR